MLTMAHMEPSKSAVCGGPLSFLHANFRVLKMDAQSDCFLEYPFSCWARDGLRFSALCNLLALSGSPYGSGKGEICLGLSQNRVDSL